MTRRNSDSGKCRKGTPHWPKRWAYGDGGNDWYEKARRVVDQLFLDGKENVQPLPRSADRRDPSLPRRHDRQSTCSRARRRRRTWER